MCIFKQILDIRLVAFMLAGVLVSGCDLFQSVDAPYFSFSYYTLTFADTETVINADRTPPGASSPVMPLTLLEWRTAVLDATREARNGGIHPTEIADFVLTQLGSDPADHQAFGNAVCTASGDIPNSDFEVPGDETDLGGVSIQMPLSSKGNGRLICNVLTNQQPVYLSSTGPRSWPNGAEVTMGTFTVSVNGVDWATFSLGNKVTITYDGANTRGSGGLWFVATDQTQGSGWFNAFDVVLVAPVGGFVLDE